MSGPTDQELHRQLLAGQARIEAMLDVIIASLAEADEQPPEVTLEGEPAGRPRDEGSPL